MPKARRDFCAKKILNGLQTKGKDTELCLVLDNRFDEFRRNFLHPCSETVDQRGITKDIDRAGNPAAGISNDLACLGGKQLGVRPHRSQTKVDVLDDLLSIKSLRWKSDETRCANCSELRRAKHVPQLRLTDEDNLQELLLICVNVRLHSKLFECVKSQVLRLVDDQDCPATS